MTQHAGVCAPHVLYRKTIRRRIFIGGCCRQCRHQSNRSTVEPKTSFNLLRRSCRGCARQKPAEAAAKSVAQQAEVLAARHRTPLRRHSRSTRFADGEFDLDLSYAHPPPLRQPHPAVPRTLPCVTAAAPQLRAAPSDRHGVSVGRQRGLVRSTPPPAARARVSLLIAFSFVFAGTATRCLRSSASWPRATASRTAGVVSI